MAANAVVSAAFAAHGQHALHQDPKALHAGHDHAPVQAGPSRSTGEAGDAHHKHHTHNARDDLAEHANHADAARDATPAGTSAAPGALMPADPGHSGCASDACCPMSAPCCHFVALLAGDETVGWPPADAIKRGARAAAVPPGQMTSPLLRPPRRLA